MDAGNTQFESEAVATRTTRTLIAIAATILIILGIFIVLYLNYQNTLNQQSQPFKNSNGQADSDSQNGNEEASVLWSYDGTKWSHASRAPECPNPLTITSPVNINLVTNLLYPGQFRGTDYKPHGGFRFGNSKNEDIKVTMPIDGVLWRGSRYIQDGEVQYLLDFINSCGIMIRLDHLLALPDEMKTYINQLPEPKTDDSRTPTFSPTKLFKTGDLIATAVGLEKGPNVFVDLGVYDLRVQNEASKKPSYLKAHQNESETAFFAICWFENLTEPSKSKIKALPGPGTEGKQSDYCT